MPKYGAAFQPALRFRGEGRLRFLVQEAEYDDADKHMNRVNGREYKEKHLEIIGHRGQPVRHLGIPLNNLVCKKYDTGQNRQPEPDAIIAPVV